MSFFIQGLDTVEKVREMRDAVDRMLLEGSFTTEYTIQGNDFRKQMVIPPDKLLSFRDDCNEFLIQELWGIPISRQSQPFICS